jgi:ornithine cyclodeaminase/alanine dehydrogenase-like protein (mu-crystallin family)
MSVAEQQEGACVWLRGGERMVGSSHGPVDGQASERPHAARAPVVLDAEDVAALPMRVAIDALDAAFARAPFPPTPQRLHLDVVATADEYGPAPREQAELLVMPAAADGWAGTKTVGLVAGNPARGLPRVTSSYTLFGPPGLTPVAVIDGAALTALRTAAVSGLATQLAAGPDARRVVIVGAGVQGQAHAHAMAAVLDDVHVTVVGRETATTDALVAQLRRALAGRGRSAPVVVAGVHADIRSADVLCLCTTSVRPVVDVEDLARGVHVNAVGAYRPDRRELTAAAVAATTVLVETRDAALAEKGDLLLAEQEGTWSRSRIRADLHEAASGTVRLRSGQHERTLFASVGHAYEDLIVARSVLDAHRDRS